MQTLEPSRELPVGDLARRRKVERLLLKHMTVTDIADELDWDRARVKSIVRLIRSEWKQASVRTYESFVEEELARLAAVERPLFERALTGLDDDAVDRWLNIVKERAKILGLYAPNRHEVVTMDAVTKEIEKLSRELEALDIDPEEVELGVGPD